MTGARADDLSAPAILRAAADLMEERMAQWQEMDADSLPPRKVDADVQIEEIADSRTPTIASYQRAVRKARRALVAHYAHCGAGGVGPRTHKRYLAADPFARFGRAVSAADLRAAADHAEARAS